MISVMLSCNPIPDVSFLEVLLRRDQRYNEVCALSESRSLFVLGQHVQLARSFPRSPKKSETKVTFSGKLSHLAGPTHSWLLALNAVL